MAEILFNKFRAAAEVLHRGRELLIESMAEDVLDQGNNLVDNGYLFNEFLEAQGTRLHFLTMVLSQLEHSADSFDERVTLMPPPSKPSSGSGQPQKRRTRAKKLPQKAPAESSGNE